MYFFPVLFDFFNIYSILYLDFLLDFIAYVFSI